MTGPSCKPPGIPVSTFSRQNNRKAKDFGPWVPAASRCVCVWGGLRERVGRGGAALPHNGEISLSSLAETGDKESSSSERA